MGAVGLAVKAFLALHAELGGTPAEHWTAVPGNFAVLIQMALADDLMRFVPELGPLLRPALEAGRAALDEDDEGSNSPV